MRYFDLVPIDIATNRAREAMRESWLALIGARRGPASVAIRVHLDYIASDQYEPLGNEAGSANPHEQGDLWTVFAASSHAA